ncbi:hypothetical protein LTS08_000205 [Lithohypha guttulata]|nr:hypothetical protein LTS08_000205 [Lithohypha guttulata]
MSFMKSLKGLADDFKGMMSDKDKDKEKQHAGETHNTTYKDGSYGASDSYHQGQYAGQHSSNPSQPQYGGPPPSQGYGPPAAEPDLPPGWIKQWDQNSQRYYYLEQATGRSQWEPPSMSYMSMDQSRGYGAPAGQTYPPHGYGQGFSQHGQGYPAPGGLAHSGGHGYPPGATGSGEKSNKGALLAAGAGGLAVGGLAGAALAGDDSDDEHRQSAPAGYGAAPSGYGTDPSYGYGAPPPMTDAQALEHNSDVSSSRRESLEEARKEYEQAQQDAADSDASSSDHEEAREAREEYQEEIEEAQEEAYDD